MTIGFESNEERKEWKRNLMAYVIVLQKLTKYKILTKLGEGAHAEVMLAEKFKKKE